MRYNSSGSRKMSKGMGVVDDSSNRTRGGNREGNWPVMNGILLQQFTISFESAS